MGEKAYITLLDNTDYIYSVIACYMSWLKTQSQYKFYCACTNNVPQIIRANLAELNIPTLELQEIKGLDRLKTKLKSSGFHSWIPALAKLGVYGLTQFEKIIFLDADTYIYKNIDHLFDMAAMSGVPDGLGRETKPYKFVQGDNYFKKFNAGVLVIEPSAELLDKIITLTQKLPIDRPWADQTIVAELYPNWINEKEKHLPIYYNCFGRHIHEYEKNIPNFSANNIYVMHLVGQKMSPTWNFLKVFSGTNAQYKGTYYNLLTNICKQVNAFIDEQHMQNKLVNLTHVLLPVTSVKFVKKGV